jgi:hypothetical protein
MLGHGAIGQFAIGQASAGATAESIYPDKWYSLFRDPVRTTMDAARIALSASGCVFPLPVINISWFSQLSDPVIIPPRLNTGSQLFSFPNPFPVINISWFNQLSSPQKLSLPILQTPSQPFFHFDPIPVVSFGWWEPLAERPWIDLRKGLAAYQQNYQINVNPIPSLPIFNWSYEPLTEPVRFKPILIPAAQPFTFGRLEPIIIFTATINTIETKDSFKLALYAYAEALNANVSIREIINSFGTAAILEKNQASAMVALSESQVVSRVGITTPQAIFANVGIVEIKP